MEKPSKIAPAKGKLGILLPGMGAVSTTFMAGVELIRRNKACPIGSLTQMGTIRLGKRTEGRATDQEIRSVGGPERSCFWRMGHFQGQRLPGGGESGRAQFRASREGQDVSLRHSPNESCIRP